MGIELHPKFLSLTGTRCYQPLCESIVANCCQKETRHGLPRVNWSHLGQNDGPIIALRNKDQTHPMHPHPL